jgi:hypothetical protein
MDSSTDARALNYKTAWLYCLLVQVRDDAPEDIQRTVAQVIPICLEQHGLVFDMMASIQLVAFGKIFRAGDGIPVEEFHHKSRTACTELLTTLGSKVKIVAFSGDISHGNIGGEGRFNCTILVPKFDRVLTALLNTEFGCMTDLGSLP